MRTSARAAPRRASSGFQYLMTEIGLDRVGSVLSLDASRLARNNSDWYRSLIMPMVGTFIAHSEQPMSPRLSRPLDPGTFRHDERAELHNLRLRLQAGARHKAERVSETPTAGGTERQRDGVVTSIPTRKFKARLRLIFRQFTELGSARRSELLAREAVAEFHRAPCADPLRIHGLKPPACTIRRIPQQRMPALTVWQRRSRPARQQPVGAAAAWFRCR